MPSLSTLQQKGSEKRPFTSRGKESSEPTKSFFGGANFLFVLGSRLWSESWCRSTSILDSSTWQSSIRWRCGKLWLWDSSSPRDLTARCLKNEAIFEAGDTCSKAHHFFGIYSSNFWGVVFVREMGGTVIFCFGEFERLVSGMFFSICLTPPKKNNDKTCPLKRDQDSKGKW